MRRSIIQNILRIFPPEVAHKIRLSLLGFAGSIPFGKWWIHRSLAPRCQGLDCEVFGTHFRNPIGVAAGYDADGDHLDELAAAGFGFIEIGSVVPYPQPGTPRPRLQRLSDSASYIDNSGYPCKGLDLILHNLRNRGHNSRRMVVGCNIGKCTSTHKEDINKEYLRVFRNMYQYVDFFVINVACNTSAKQFVPRNREELLALIEPLFEFRRGQLDYRPILLKISPDLSWEEIDDVVSILIETPLDGIEAVSGSREMLTEGNGAISGAMLTERSIEIVRYISQRTDGNYPIIGSGGMMTPDDICRMLDAGASLVALNSGLREYGIKLLKNSAKALFKAKIQGGITK